MPRTPGIKETAPRRTGGGRSASRTYEERYKEDPGGSTNIALLLDNLTLRNIERKAQQEGVSVQAWIRSQITLQDIEGQIL